MKLFSKWMGRKKAQPGNADVLTPDAEPAELFEADDISESVDSGTANRWEIPDLWHDNPESLRRHMGPTPTPELVMRVEDALGYKLPSSYISLMLSHNGGLVNRCRCPVPHPVEGSPDTVYITEIMGIGFETPYSLCGRFGSEFLIDSRRHKKDIGIAICNTTLPGRALVFLDYRGCGRTGEPCVTWADAVDGTELLLAHSFAEFVSALEANTAREKS